MSIVKGRGAVSGNKIQDTSKATKVAVEDTANRIEFTTNSLVQGYINNVGDIVFGTAGTSGVPGIEMVRADAGTDFGIKLKNTSNGDVRLGLALASQSFSIGLDNSDGDKLKISTNEDDVGTGTLLTLTPSGDLGLGVEAPAEKLEVDGNIALGDGSAAAPALRSRNDADTGIYWPAADQLCISIGGSDLLCADSTGATVEGTLTAEGFLGESYAQTSTSGSTSIVDTGITVAEGEVYEIMVIGNPDAVENGNFRDIINLKIYITCGTDGTVKKYINVIQDFSRGTLHPSGGGPLDADAVMLNATTEYTEVSQATATTLRIKVSGYTSTVGANQDVKVKRLI